MGSNPGRTLAAITATAALVTTGPAGPGATAGAVVEVYGGSVAAAAAPGGDRALAASVLFGCADSRDARAQRTMARAGVAGLVLLGDRTPPGLRSQLRRVAESAPVGREPMLASDEEGGTVQRLADAIYRLPSAETMGRWPDSRIERAARHYGARMADLGVEMSLAPVADLNVPGSYIDDLGRGFSAEPRRVGRAAIAWSRGLTSAGVTPVVKHWPGHGHARDTHRFAASVPSFAALQRADLIPFQLAFDAGIDAVMVAHVRSAGLTGGKPATQSRKAMRVLREQAGPDTVIITDSLSMAAASSARGLSQSQAVIAALDAGADWAMVCTDRTLPIVRDVADAIGSGRLDRRLLLRSAARIEQLRTN